MFCTNCGTKLPDNVKFCVKCGAKVSKVTENESSKSVASEPVPSIPKQKENADSYQATSVTTNIEEKDGTLYFQLAQMAMKEKNELRALKLYEQAWHYGCDEAKSALSVLTLSLAQKAEEKSMNETGKQSIDDLKMAISYYRDSQNYCLKGQNDHLTYYKNRKFMGIIEKQLELGILLGNKLEQQGDATETLKCYESQMCLESNINMMYYDLKRDTSIPPFLKAHLWVARTYVNPQKEGYNFQEAWQTYKLIENWLSRYHLDNPDKKDERQRISEEWEQRKLLAPLADRVACLTKELEEYQKLGYESLPYYVGKKLAGPLDNAMKAYGKQAGIEQDQVVILYDSTHAILWGKGKQGFLITKDGQLISSLGLRISLDQLGPVNYDNNMIYEISTNRVLARVKRQYDSFDVFCNRLNRIVLPLNPKE